MQTGYTRLLCLLGCLLYTASASAGGPLVLEGPTGNTPVKYTSAVTLNFDQGQLLNSLTNTQIDNIIVQGLDTWNNVSSSTVQISQGADLPADITAANYTSVFDDAANSPTYTDNINPVIYDNDGSIIDDFFGAGQSNSIAGFAASIFEVNGDVFREGYAVLNGKTSLGLDGNKVLTIVIHEIGHLIGLDHSQLDIDNSETTGNICTTAASRDDYPALYPFLCRTGLDLHFDDITAVSTLYPVSTFNQDFGQLRGNFTTAAGTPILGANLWVEETTTGDKASIVSDYLMQANGFFNLYLPAGTYTLHANSINPLFTEASSVGPYATSATDTSFVAPHPISEIDYQGSTGSSVALTINVGEANEVTFRSDGTGTDSGGNAIIDPVTTGGSTSSGSSSIGISSLLILLSAFLLRIFRAR